MKEELNKLKEVAFSVIEDEGLPRPTKIHFRHSLSGVRSKKGFCEHKTNKLTGDVSFRILIHTVKAKFYPDPDGDFIDKITKETMSRCLVGDKISFDKLVKVTAHEISHIKFWRHDAQHHSYTNYIHNKLLAKLEA